jgi:hypothetical protein
MAAMSFRIKEWAWTACRTPLAFVIVLGFIQMWPAPATRLIGLLAILQPWR